MHFIQKESDPLQCGICKNALSIFPIHSSRDWKHSCGRCWPTIQDNGYIGVVRNFAYEALARHMFFPCMYSPKGCSKELVPESLASHENICDYNPVGCIKPCTWRDVVDKLYKHYVDEHEGRPIKNQEKIKIVSDAAEYLLYACNELFLVSVCKLSTSLDVSVVPVKRSVPVDNYNYDVKFHTSWSRRAMVNGELLYQAPKRARFEMDKLPVHNVAVVCQVVVTSNTVKATPSSKLSKLHKTISKHLLCKLCNENIAPPVYECSSCFFKSCEVCSKKVEGCYCLFCGSCLVRNRSLESILDGWTYACKFDECNKLMPGSEKKSHEKKCAFRSHHCFHSNCSFEGKYNQLWNHIKATHGQYLSGQDISISEEMHCFKTGGCIFAAQFKRAAKPVSISSATGTQRQSVSRDNFDNQRGEWTLGIQYRGRTKLDCNFRYVLRINLNGSSPRILYIKRNYNLKSRNRLTLPGNMTTAKDRESSVKITIEEVNT